MQEATFTFNLQGPKPRDPQGIYYLAQSFYLAGNRSSLNVEVGPGMTQSLVSPAVVSYCFAIELFCKALITETGAKPKTIHLLDKLFRAIPKDARSQIETMYSQLVPNPDMTTLLSQASNYFQEVRYQYEYNIFQFHDHPLAMLAKSMYQYCAQRFGMPQALSEVSA